MPEGLHGFETPRDQRRHKAREHADQERASTDHRDISGIDVGRQFAEAIDAGGEKFEASDAAHEVQKFVAIMNGQNSESKTGGDAKEAHNQTLGEKNPN